MTITLQNRIPITAAILILLGVLVVVTPWYIFPICEANKTTDNSMSDMHMGSDLHMICWYTAEAEVGIGLLLILTGLARFAIPDRFSQKTTGILGVVFGIIVILIPTVFIGVCNTSDAPCRIGTLPALILLGALTAIVGIYLAISKDPAPEASP